MNEKTYKIQVTSKKENIVEGTLDYLKEYFGYTLLLGHQENKKIKTEFKNIKELVTAIQKSYNEIEKACYNRTYVDLIK
jgi:hypothetical protein